MKFKSILPVAASALLLTSCLKSSSDLAGTLDDSGSIVTEIAEIAYHHYYGSTQSLALNTTPPTETIEVFNLRAGYPRNTKPAGDIKVTITATSAPAGTTMLPSGAYTMAAETVIPRAEGKAPVTITLNKAGLNPSLTYGLTFTIASVSEGVISELGKTIDVYFNLKNQWDGVYRLKGETFHPTNATLAGPVGPYEMELITYDAASVFLNPTHPWANGSGSATPAGYNPVYTIGGGGAVTISNPNPLGFVNSPGYTSRYDAGTKTFFAKWQYPGAGGDRVFTDTLTYLRPR